MSRQPHLGWIALGVVGLCLLPFVASAYQSELLAGFLLFGILAMSLDLHWGYMGELSFGQSVFFGIGAYAMTLSLRGFGGLTGTYLGLLFAVVLPILAALLLGWFLFYGGVAGEYFAIISMALAMIFTEIGNQWSSVTGGHNGIFEIPPLEILPGWQVNTEVRVFYVAVAATLLAYLAARWIISSHLGRVVDGLSDNPERTTFFGYQIGAYKTAMLVLSAAIAGFAGAIYAGYARFVSPELLGLTFGTEIVIWVALGGRRTLLGGLLGTVLVKGLEQYVSAKWVSIWPILVGGFFLVVVFVMPEGILHLFRRMLRSLRRSGTEGVQS